MSRIATVFVATGLQGTSAIHALLKDGTFKPRAVTRNAHSDSALALAALGCEVVEATFTDKEAIKRAVTGAECVFLVTLPFQRDVPEYTQGVNVIEASKEAGVKFIAFSTLPGLKDISQGKYTKGALFDDKADIQKYLEASGISCASICPGSFVENVMRPVMSCNFEKADTGYVFSTREPLGYSYSWTWIDRDMGPAVTALFTQYTTRLPEINKKTFALGSQRMTAEEFAATLSRGLGEPIQVKHLDNSGIDVAIEMYACVMEFDLSPWIDVPDKRLEALGVRVGAIEDFARTTLKEHLKA
ncbi:hypothetical protein BD626DRAFT_262100 [Schizophyllum amplum]|uniref:NmrA-like domain-containing protein n=1 Tax=Schizophyllum amplum TaxID=97359 RepID=A0A550CGE0_9AGAR|nr:hypothetical protein BD626DRAFT_262100 [Auriculariopsis ampla]